MSKRTSTAAVKQGGQEATEPIGIVISSGTRVENQPRFAAYVWGPVPDGDIAEECVAVA